MTSRVLVAYASREGSTAQMAEQFELPKRAYLLQDERGTGRMMLLFQERLWRPQANYPDE
jgi:hypothetical protein